MIIKTLRTAPYGAEEPVFGAEHWVVIASLIETCKPKGVEPLACHTDFITRIVNGHPNWHIDDLLPWTYITATEIKAVA